MLTTFFMWNHVCNAFVRNDNAPTIAMLATLVSSLFNVLMDYLLMFPLKMGMPGAALATALSPVIGILICCVHLFSRKSHVHIVPCIPSITLLFRCCQVGFSAFIGEISSGIITMVFNFLILDLTGNIGVAAYGIVANCALVGTAIFNGVAQGSQPLVSEYCGRGEVMVVRSLRRMSLLSTYFLAALLYVGILFFAPSIVAIFNGEQNPALQTLAETGLTLYFMGFFFSGSNIVGSSYFSAIEDGTSALILSLLRGFFLILVSAFLLSYLFGMTGIWLAYAVAECITMVVLYWLLRRRQDHITHPA